MKNYFEILNAFGNENIPYVAIGTWALKLAYPEKMNNYKINDCDIIVENDIRIIKKIIRILKAKNWITTVWEVEINDKVSEQFLLNKYYLRARQGVLTLDITYECPYIAWESLNTQKRIIKSFNLASLQHIIHLKRIKGTSKDLEVIEIFKK